MTDATIAAHSVFFTFGLIPVPHSLRTTKEVLIDLMSDTVSAALGFSQVCRERCSQLQRRMFAGRSANQEPSPSESTKPPNATRGHDMKSGR
jgi:hypothetical protein